ncbi:hypothetical protein, partial [Escherichia coli]|uniref:hypothetical protein n=1 Tax=Escherichia coli TaxID=562 RepID=UPI001BDCB9A1
WLMMSLWDALRMNMMISYQELVRTFPNSLRSVVRLRRAVSPFSKPEEFRSYDPFIDPFWLSH